MFGFPVLVMPGGTGGNATLPPEPVTGEFHPICIPAGNDGAHSFCPYP